MPFPSHAISGLIGRLAAGRQASAVWLLLWVFLPVGSRAHGQTSTNRVLQSADQVRRLSPELAATHLPVRLRAVVTFHDRLLYSRFVQDETAGIYLQEGTNLPAFGPGDVVEIEGETGAGEYAPIVVPRSLKVVGEAPMPTAHPASVEELVSGRQDSQFVEIVGTVRAVRFEAESLNFLVDLVTGGERLTVCARHLPTTNTAALVESVVRVRGVCSTLFNRQRQLFGFRLLVPRASDFTIEQLADPAPFEIPSQEITSLLRFTARGSFGRRVKLAGTVVYHEPGVALFIQDKQEGLYCQIREFTPLQTGDQVEVLGFPAKGEYTPVLQDATYRKTGAGLPPEPVTIGLDEALAGAHDCRLVRLTGKLLEYTRRGREQFIVVEKDGFVFHAYLARESDGAGFPRAQIGSEIAAVGICLIERGSSWQAGEGWRAKSFRILLRSPRDVTVLRAPPWLDVRRVLWIAGALGLLALVATAGVAVLHRQVTGRTRQLEVQIVEGQLAERRREIEQERTRLAQDLHDDLGAGLTEVNMLSSLVRSPMTSMEEKSRYLDDLTRSAERMVTSLDEIVWAVNPRNDTVASLASYFGSYAQRFLELAAVTCGLDVAEDLPEHPLDPHLRQGLFLAFKEALSNVVRHSGATHVMLRISIEERQLVVEITDDGRGLALQTPPVGSDGLANMEARMKSLGGHCEIPVGLKHGTTVRFRVPLPTKWL